MSVLYVALPVAIALGAAAMWACVRSIRGGQFDDLETPAMRMLIDDQAKKNDEQPAGEQDSHAPRESRDVGPGKLT